MMNTQTGCRCHEAHEHSHNSVHNRARGPGLLAILRIAAGIALFAAALFTHFTVLRFALYLASYAVLGYDVVISAVKNLFRGRMFDENFLMTLATGGAFAIGEHPEAVAVMLFYQVGEYFQGMAVRRSRKSIAGLMDIRPDYANLVTAEGLLRTAPESVQPGDIIAVKPGERIPLDGDVLTGVSALDTKALTGEAVPLDVEAGSAVLSGCVNLNGLLEIKVTKPYGESTVSKIIEMTENASARKASSEKLITAFARIYTPAVVGLALILALLPPLFLGGWVEWLHRALVFLVISCPCALVLSVPLTFFGGIGRASKSGILVKGGNFIEALCHLDTVVFDKTGTLTKGVFAVASVYPAEGVSREALLRAAALAEAFSNHPIALSIRQEYGRTVDTSTLSAYTEIPGMGVSVTADGARLSAGSAAFMEREGITFNALSDSGTKVYAAADGKYLGCVVITDTLKPDSRAAVAALKTLGVKKAVMLTGDNEQTAQTVAAGLALDGFYAQLLPHQKVERLEALDAQKAPKTKLAFVGDGINDAPVLARADIGVAMGGLGSDAAIEAADIVLMTDEPSKLADAVKIAKATRRIVIQNITFALAVKLLFLTLGALNIAGMWEAVFADTGVSLLAVVNALRILRVKL